MKGGGPREPALVVEVSRPLCPTIRVRWDVGLPQVETVVLLGQMLEPGLAPRLVTSTRGVDLRDLNDELVLDGLVRGDGAEFVVGPGSGRDDGHVRSPP